MSAPDFQAIAARKVHGLPEEWQPRIYELLDDSKGFRLTGAVPIGVISRGPRKGRPKWPPLRELQAVIITRADIEAVRAEWVAATGLCPRCGGSGRIAWKVCVKTGTEFVQCRACNGTGEAYPLQNKEGKD